MYDLTVLQIINSIQFSLGYDQVLKKLIFLSAGWKEESTSLPSPASRVHLCSLVHCPLLPFSNPTPVDTMPSFCFSAIGNSSPLLRTQVIRLGHLDNLPHHIFSTSAMYSVSRVWVQTFLGSLLYLAQLTFSNNLKWRSLTWTK